MDTSLLKLRKLRYRPLRELLGKPIAVPELNAIGETLLRELIPWCANSFHLHTSERDIAIGVAKYGVLDLRFVARADDLLSDSDVATLEVLRELGFFDDERKKDGLELGCKDGTGAKDVADSVNEKSVFFIVTLTSRTPTEALHDFMAEVAAELSLGVCTEAAVDAVLRRRIENAASQFPRTFVVEEAFLANSDSIHLKQSFYM